MSLLLLWAALVSQASIETEGEPVRDVKTVVVLTDVQGRPRGGETVRVVHRTGLSGEREIAIGITDALGRVRWTPEIAGVAELRAGDATKAIAIGWPSVPSNTAVLLGLLVIAGLGGAGYGVAGRRRRP